MHVLLLLLTFAARSLSLEPAFEMLLYDHQASLEEARYDPVGHFRAWATLNQKPYIAATRQNDVQSGNETETRFFAWLSNLDFAVRYNSVRGRTHWLGMTPLADLTAEEYTRHYLGYNYGAKLTGARPPDFRRGWRYENVTMIPEVVDWRQHGAVSEVKNQAQCGSCWAFATTGAVEGVNAIATHRLVSASEQELVDCDRRGEDQGCQGGLMDYAYQFIIDNEGIDTERDYPYLGTESNCDKHKLRRHRVLKIDGFQDVPENNETALQIAAAHQPVSVAIEADSRVFQLYAGGVLTEKDGVCGTSLDHGVLIVGYGVEENVNNYNNESLPYWIVKNSWGAEWGEGGYIRLQRGSSDARGLCGVAMVASYPILENMMT